MARFPIFYTHKLDSVSIDFLMTNHSFSFLQYLLMLTSLLPSSLFLCLLKQPTFKLNYILWHWVKVTEPLPSIKPLFTLVSLCIFITTSSKMSQLLFEKGRSKALLSKHKRMALTPTLTFASPPTLPETHTFHHHNIFFGWTAEFKRIFLSLNIN